MLKSEIQQEVIISHFVKASAAFKECPESAILAGLRRKLKRFIRSSEIETIKKMLALSPSDSTLFEVKPELFEKYVLQNFSIRTGNRHIEGIPEKDKIFKINIITYFLTEETAKLSAEISNRSVASVRSEMHEEVENILNAYRRLLNTNNTN